MNRHSVSGVGLGVVGERGGDQLVKQRQVEGCQINDLDCGSAVGDGGVCCGGVGDPAGHRLAPAGGTGAADDGDGDHDRYLIVVMTGGVSGIGRRRRSPRG